MNVLLEILPLFIVRLVAKQCPARRVGDRLVQVPRPGVMIEVEEKIDRDDCLTGYGLGV